MNDLSREDILYLEYLYVLLLSLGVKTIRQIIESPTHEERGEINE